MLQSTNIFTPFIENKKVLLHQSGTNIALNGIASQSSDNDKVYRHARVAIDGNFKPPTTRTLEAENNWWQVDLQGIYITNCVVIWTRQDWSKHLSGAILDIIGQDRKTVITSYSIGDATDKPKVEFCMGVYGASLVRVRLPRYDFLSLLEVEVFGEEVRDEVLDLKMKIKGTEISASYDNSYGSNPSDGTFNQDFGGGVVVDLHTITMYGNAWKAFKLPNPLRITKSTMMKFKFQVLGWTEGNAICLDEDKNEDTYGGLQKRCFAIVINDDDGRNQVDKWSNVEKVVVDDSLEYTVNLGRLSNDQDITVKYLTFIQDNDISPRQGSSYFSNIQIYENTSPVSNL